MQEEINPQSQTPPNGNQAKERTDDEHSSTPDASTDAPSGTSEEVSIEEVDQNQLTPKEAERIKAFQADYTRKTQALKEKEREIEAKLSEIGQPQQSQQMSDDELRQVLGESNPLYREIRTSKDEVQSLKKKIEILERANKYATGETLKTTLKMEQKEALEEAPELKSNDGKLTKEGKLILEKATETWKNDRLGRTLTQIIKEDYMPAFYLGKNVASMGKEIKKQSNLTMGATAPSKKADLNNLDWGQLTPEQRMALKKQTG